MRFLISYDISPPTVARLKDAVRTRASPLNAAAVQEKSARPIKTMLTRTSDYDSVSERTYRQIRIDIIFGKLLPAGEELKLDRLREDYGASVGTLRELLNRLASEGLGGRRRATRLRGRAGLGRDLREIAALRLLLKSHALTQSFAVGDMDWEGRVVSAYHKLSAVEKKLVSKATAPILKPGSATTGNSTTR